MLRIMPLNAVNYIYILHKVQVLLLWLLQSCYVLKSKEAINMI